jgi:alkylmercury lyase
VANAHAPIPDIPTADDYWAALQPHLPAFSLDEQRVAIALYRELAKGRAVDAVQLGRTLGFSLAETRALLQRDSIKTLSYADGEGRLLGFGGLAVVPMLHRFEVDSRKLSTWCAWDSLFIPEILGRSAHVTSADPESGGTVRLTVTPERIERVEPHDAVISFIWPDARVFESSAANVMKRFCHFIFFFESRSSGDGWASKHPGTLLFSLGDAFLLAKRLNANNFGSQLATL